MGVAAGHYVGRAKLKARQQPGDRRDRRASTVCRSPRTRSQGFKDAWPKPALKVTQPGRGRVHRRVRREGHVATCCRRRRSIDADVEPRRRPGRRRARRDRQRPVATSSSSSAAPGSKNMMDMIQADDSVVKATVTYTAVDVLRRRSRWPASSPKATECPDLVEREIPASDHRCVRDRHQGQRGPIHRARLPVLTSTGRDDRPCRSGWPGFVRPTAQPAVGTPHMSTSPTSTCPDTTRYPQAATNTAPRATPLTLPWGRYERSRLRSPGIDCSQRFGAIHFDGLVDGRGVDGHRRSFASDANEASRRVCPAGIC